MFDVYSQRANHENKLVERLCIGGYEKFEDGVSAVRTLEDTRRGRNDTPRLFFVKVCKHVETDARTRSSLKDDYTDRQHSGSLDIGKLIDAYFGM